MFLCIVYKLFFAISLQSTHLNFWHRILKHSIIKIIVSYVHVFCRVFSLQDHPSSDSFYDSDAADIEVPVEKVEREEVEQIDGETAEVDGEWGRQTNLFVTCTLFN